MHYRGVSQKDTGKNKEGSEWHRQRFHAVNILKTWNILFYSLGLKSFFAFGCGGMNANRQQPPGTKSKQVAGGD
jgi:hypothetical protein